MGTSRRARLLRDAWVDGALTLLAREGSHAVEVQPLARLLKVTKGSFYWHFSGRPALLEAALRRWEAVETSGVIDSVEAQGGTASERLRRLFGIALDRRAIDLEVALRQWAKHDPRARRAVQRVDERRLGYVRRLYGEAGLSAAAAAAYALLAYSTLLGEAFVDLPSSTPKARSTLWLGVIAILLEGLPTKSTLPVVAPRRRVAKENGRSTPARGGRRTGPARRP